MSIIKQLEKKYLKRKLTHEERASAKTPSPYKKIGLKKYDVMILSGGFDPVHVGHLRMFQAAARMADKVIVGCNSDAWLLRKKGYVFMPLEERKEIIKGFSCVHEVHSFKDDDNTANDLIMKVSKAFPGSKIAFGNGGDRTKKNTPEQITCANHEVEVVWGVGGENKAQSSSDLVDSVKQTLDIEESYIPLSPLVPKKPAEQVIDHPEYYNKAGTEVIDIIEENGYGGGFCYGNAIKYLLRAPHKEDEKRDLEKAIWYIKRIIENG